MPKFRVTYAENFSVYRDYLVEACDDEAAREIAEELHEVAMHGGKLHEAMVDSAEWTDTQLLEIREDPECPPTA